MSAIERWVDARHLVVLLFLGALFAASWVNEARDASDAGRQIERLAKFQSRWKTGLAAPMITYIKWENQKDGVVTFIGDAIEFQIGFNARQPHIYSCSYNVLSKKVISVDAEPGRL